jgi:hypothetical protein
VLIPSIAFANAGIYRAFLSKIFRRFKRIRKTKGGAKWILWIIAAGKIKIGIQLREKKISGRKNDEQAMTEEMAWEVRNGMGMKEELLKIIDGESEEVTKEESITITAIGAGEGLKKRP